MPWHVNSENKSKYRKVGVLPIWIVQSNVTSGDPSSERNSLSLSYEGPMLETFDVSIRIGSTPNFSYFDLYLYSAYAGNHVQIVKSFLPCRWGHNWIFVYRRPWHVIVFHSDWWWLWNKVEILQFHSSYVLFWLISWVFRMTLFFGMFHLIFFQV